MGRIIFLQVPYVHFQICRLSGSQVEPRGQYLAQAAPSHPDASGSQTVLEKPRYNIGLQTLINGSFKDLVKHLLPAVSRTHPVPIFTLKKCHSFVG